MPKDLYVLLVAHNYPYTRSSVSGSVYTNTHTFIRNHMNTSAYTYTHLPRFTNSVKIWVCSEIRNQTGNNYFKNIVFYIHSPILFKFYLSFTYLLMLYYYNIYLLSSDNFILKEILLLIIMLNCCYTLQMCLYLVFIYILLKFSIKINNTKYF